jgi:phage/plasmid-like protein (TIGR03299 family)
MSHNLTQRADNMIEFAYAEGTERPWHGLGQVVPVGASIEEWQRAAGMDWRIRRAKVRYPVSPDTVNDASQYIEIPDQHVLFRSDNNEALGVVSSRYKTVQPREVIEFFRDIVRVGGLELSAAGTILGGRKYWATAKIGEAAPVSVQDKIGGYLLISTSADGSLSTEVRRTTVRTVCSNTLAMAMKDAPASVRITHRSEFDPEKIKDFMGLNSAAWDAFRHQIVRLANKPLNEERAEELAVEIFGGQQDKIRASAGFNKVMDLFNGDGKGAKLDGVKGTAWGLVNAFTEYVDWFTRARSTENRFVSSQWGQGADLKQRALEVLESAEV